MKEWERTFLKENNYIYCAHKSIKINCTCDGCLIKHTSGDPDKALKTPCEYRHPFRSDTEFFI